MNKLLLTEIIVRSVFVLSFFFKKSVFVLSFFFFFEKMQRASLH